MSESEGEGVECGEGVVRVSEGLVRVRVPSVSAGGTLLMQGGG